MNIFWAVLNIECEIVREAKPGKYPQKQRNIATPKLIQWKIAKMRGNKPFHGFRHFVFSFFELFPLRELFCSPILHLLLTIAGNR